ncbi:hypothetical protein ACFYTC_10555 [Actinomadura nitritigenes]|uniref:hypothetical protein n=1 Tax=Actinomadura nitritigenes TaxID=134602 RepID=UPI003696CFB5
MPTRGWLSRIDEASGTLLIGVAIVAGAAVALGLLACVVLVFAGVVHALIPYWAYILAAFGLLVVLPLTVSGIRNSGRSPERKTRTEPPRRGPSGSSYLGASGWDAPPRRHSGTSIDWHTATSYSCRCCGHNWTSHGRGQGSCSVEGPPYTTETTVGWEGDIIQTESGTPCGCSRYEGIEPS